jgi:hypothetical protein
MVLASLWKQKLTAPSDLMAILHLQGSGLERHQENVPYPNMALLQGFEQHVLESYLGQLHLRTHTSVLNALINPDEKFNDSFKYIQAISSAIFDTIRLHSSVAFREGDQPADNILEARLRAKYWDAQVITYRPFIWYISQISQFRGRTDCSTKKYSEVDPRIIGYARKGVDALVESIRVFHGLGGSRPIISDPFVTAFALVDYRCSCLPATPLLTHIPGNGAIC